MLAAAWFLGLWLALGAIGWVVVCTIRRLEADPHARTGL
jgi:hypothetical protein